MSQFFTSGGQSIGVSASASVFPMNIQDWFPLGLTGLISYSPRDSQEVFPTNTVQKHRFFSTQLSFLGGSEGKESACNAGDLGSIPGLGRFPGEGNGNALQYFFLEIPMDRGAWWAIVHGVGKIQTWLSMHTLRRMALWLPCSSRFTGFLYK